MYEEYLLTLKALQTIIMNEQVAKLMDGICSFSVLLQDDGDDGFYKCYEQCVRSCEAFLEKEGSSS
jgi:hypothetical protein